MNRTQKIEHLLKITGTLADMLENARRNYQKLTDAQLATRHIQIAALTKQLAELGRQIGEFKSSHADH